MPRTECIQKVAQVHMVMLCDTMRYNVQYYIVISSVVDCHATMLWKKSWTYEMLQA